MIENVELSNFGLLKPTICRTEVLVVGCLFDEDFKTDLVPLILLTNFTAKVRQELMVPLIPLKFSLRPLRLLCG